MPHGFRVYQLDSDLTRIAKPLQKYINWNGNALKDMGSLGFSVHDLVASNGENTETIQVY